jgi:hypothetical protein
MSYIGANPTTAAFLTDQFSGNGSTTAFTLSAAPANTNSILVAISGVLQDPTTYSVTGTTLTFSPAPPSGTGNISVRFLGIPASGVVTTAYRTVTEFTATAGQTTFTPPSYTVGFIDVYRNGVLLGSADFTASNGTTVVLVNPATAGDLIETVSFFVSSVLNAIPATAGAVGTANIANDVTINFADGSASAPSITNNGDTNTGIFFPAADTIAFAEGGVESMRVDSSGNLNIGTTGYPYRITAVRQSDGIVGYFRREGGTVSPALFVTANETGNTVGFGTDYAGATSPAMTFSTQTAERMRIDSGGNVLVGTSTAYNDGSIGTPVLQWTTLIGARGGAVSRANGTTTASHLAIVNPNGLVGNITSSGSSTTYATNSDYRLKENIAPMTGALATVQQLKPVTYKWKVDGSSSQGFIAHELQAVVPDCVTGEKDAVDEEGNPKYQGIDTSFLVATLTAAIQELKTELDSVKAELAELKGTL